VSGPSLGIANLVSIANYYLSTIIYHYLPLSTIIYHYLTFRLGPSTRTFRPGRDWALAVGSLSRIALSTDSPTWNGPNQSNTKVQVAACSKWEAIRRSQVKGNACAGQDLTLTLQLPSASMVDVYEALPSYLQPFYCNHGYLVMDTLPVLSSSNFS
jgi:hypothetical protein